MTAIWPDDLPCCPLDGISAGPRSARIVTPVDVGPPKMRRRGAPLRTIALAHYFDANQRARFDRFWDEDLRYGTLPFLYRDPHFNNYLLSTELGAVLQDENGVPIRVESWILCVFSANQPTWSKRGGKFFPQFEIVELP
ncbi:hypothetical protein ABIF38_006426 [Bradyrhizobium japonicum]|uniref:hypothetical protein n=1 Tax=Bradyrhizobium elkanii TaxID=29448 RepID=UPI000379DFFF|nr:hypothetical protein [Bradyrhizobium elkanii]WAX24357.1 hypothetical protein [Bradyrhizobium phage ppBeUSDA76-1]MCP1731266.1 hypothetical protein [Bradyrhizobium elkanii]MCS3575395.1 hypothetical protein [Bradyrhizobium elkanii]MCS3591914.1 hypothetical protein [Bradyrhizobium elkanii]MCS3621359.1 hypothetical protein [Bradyrhizobium elkanii]